MALSDLSFKLYNNAALTSAFSGTYQLTHETDLSDNPQDMMLYFGSTNSNAVLKTTTNPGVNTIYLTPTDILPEWSASTSIALGASVQPTTANTYRYECTTAGTTATGEPASWPTTLGATVSDANVVWTCRSKKHEETEIKLATTATGLGAAGAGSALGLGTSLSGGATNATQVHIRVTNAVITTGTNATTPEIGININSVTETSAT